MFLEFDVRYPRPLPYKQGLKFCKVFGDDGDGITTFDYANVTYNPDYDSNGEWTRISFGDGSTTGNDTSNVIYFEQGINPSWVGRIYPNEIIDRPYNSGYQFDDNWHTIRIHHKYNSGTSAVTEQPDAIASIWIDGVLILSATRFYNRHYSNPLTIKGIEWGGWTQNTGEFDIDYRNIKISLNNFV